MWRKLTFEEVQVFLAFALREKSVRSGGCCVVRGGASIAKCFKDTRRQVIRKHTATATLVMSEIVVRNRYRGTTSIRHHYVLLLNYSFFAALPSRCLLSCLWAFAWVINHQNRSLASLPLCLKALVRLLKNQTAWCLLLVETMFGCLDNLQIF